MATPAGSRKIHPALRYVAAFMLFAMVYLAGVKLAEPTKEFLLPLIGRWSVNAPLTINRYQTEQFDSLTKLQDELIAAAPAARKTFWSNLDFSSIGAFEQSQVTYRNSYCQLIGIPDPLRVPQDVKLEKSEPVGTVEGIRIERWYLRSPHLSVVFIALVGFPAGPEPHSVVIGVHGSGGSPERVFGIDTSKDYHKNFGITLAKAGYMVVVPYMIYDTADPLSFEVLGMSVGMRLIGTEVGQIMRTVDYLMSRKDVNQDRIGIYGISVGGVTARSAAACDPRISAAIVSGASHRDQITTSKRILTPVWFRLDRDLTNFTTSTIPYLIAPRAFFVEQGDEDGFDEFRVQEGFESAQDVYRRLGILDRVGLQRAKGGHEVYLQDSLQFLLRVMPPAK